MKKTKISKLIAIAITIQFIFSGIPASAYESLDNLRPQAGAQRDGGDVNVLGSDLVNYVNSRYASFVRFYAENFKVAGKTAKDQEKNVGQVLLLPQLKKLYEDGKLAGSLLAHSANRKFGIDELSKAIEQGLTSPVTNIETARKEAEAEAIKIIKKLDLSFEIDMGTSSVNTSFWNSLNNAQKSISDEIFKAWTAPRFNKAEAKAEARERAVARYNEIINHRIQALLDTNIEVINVCVGSEKKDITLEQQISEIQQQLEKYFDGVTQEKLKGKIVKVYFEPTALIGKIAEAGAGQDAAAEEDMIRDVHQAMFDWLEKKFGVDLAKSMYGKSFLTDYGASVDGKNVKRVMAVKSVRDDMKDTPLVHGVLFATSGKDVLGFLEVADGVQEAAIRDNARYDCFVNLKNFNVTVPVEYLREIYAAVYRGRINPARVDLSIADNDKNLEGWINALALAEKDRQAIDHVAMEKLLFNLGTFTDTQTFSQLRTAINRLSPEQIERLRTIANADKYSKFDMERRLSLVLKPVNVFVSAGNAVIFSEGGFKSWLDMWEPGQNIVAIKTLSGAKQLSASEFVRQNFYSGGVFARYQIPGLRLGGVISRQEVEQAGLNWGDVVQKLTKKENNWA
ncbi:MAG: triose-phosphate isomerase, partial [Candidatus Omnitrophota bacterium]